MQVTSGNQYTFSFVPSGIDLSGPFSSQADAVVKQLLDSGFPISGATGKSNGTAGGYLGTSSIDVTFTYNGGDTDSDSLGKAMASNLTDNFSTASFDFNGAMAGPAENVGLLDSIKARLGITSGGSAKTATSPSLTTIVVGAIAILVLLVFVFGFSQGLANKV